MEGSSLTAPPLQTGPSVWDASTPAIANKTWLHSLDDNELRVLGDAALEVASRSSDCSESLDLDALTDVVEALRPTCVGIRMQTMAAGVLDEGLGLALLRGLPVNDWGRARSAAAFLLLSRLMGPLRPQNAAGHALGHVRDLGLSSSDPSVRVYQTSERQTFHTDSCDVGESAMRSR